MNSVMRKCSGCRAYTLGAKCPACGAATSAPHPAKYSPEDKYAKYRRAEKYGGA